MFTALAFFASMLTSACSRLGNNRVYGHPHGASIRTATHVATLIETQEPYMPSLHRDPSKDRHRLALLLHTVDGSVPPQLIQLGTESRFGEFAQSGRLLGADGPLIWMDVKELLAFDTQKRRLLTTADLRRANPHLAKLLEQCLPEVDGRLRVTSTDYRQAYEFDPVTLKATPAKPGHPSILVKGYESLDPYFCKTLSVSNGTCLGLNAAASAVADLTPGSTYNSESSTTFSYEPRQLFQGRIDRESVPPRLESITLLPGEPRLGAVFLRNGPKEAFLRPPGPPSGLMLWNTRQSLDGTVVVGRVGLDGKFLWQTNTGISDLDQILPDPAHLALIGRRPRIPDKLQEPILVLIDTATGAVRTNSLWTREW